MAEWHLKGWRVREGIYCFQCRYDLRGLNPSGVCPECGKPVEYTFQRLEEIRLRRGPPLEESDPRWLREIREGLLLLLVALGLTLIHAVLPNSLYAWRTPPRAVMLGLLCTTWVLAHWACWKMGAKDRRLKRPHLGVRLIVRVTIFISLLAPFPFGLKNLHLIEAIGYFLIPVLAAIILLPGIMMVVLRTYAIRSGLRWIWLANLLVALAPLNGVYQAMLDFRFNGDESSLGLMLALPVPLIGVPGLFYELSDFLTEPVAIPWIIPALAVTGSIAGLAWVLLREVNRVLSSAGLPKQVMAGISRP